MPSTDDRIVRMEFDNAGFERKIQSTLTSLGELDKALKLTGATKGLEDVSQAAGKVNFGSISEGIEGISRGFLAMSTVAITALANITTAAMHAGAQVAKAFTVSPVIQGFQEYETQLNSIQTILANTAAAGTTLDQVNAALQQLNEYSDKTIYNFGQMARNIGTFTAAGVDLDTSVNAIKGIANLAAMSGSNAEQASTAMYQLSQAIASGSVKLMDWNSVVNAGMGGEVFKTALFETAKAMGNVLNVPVDQTFSQWEDAGNSFRDSLQDGWITADILTTTLSTFTGDMTEEMLLAKGFSEAQAANILKVAATAKAAATEVKTFTQLIGTVKEAVATGWADSFKIIVGNFNEAKTLWTGVNNAIGSFVQKTSDARNEVLQGWKDFGGRTALIDALKSAFHSLGEVLRTIGEAFRSIFPATTSADLIRMTASFRDFITSLIPSVATIDKIRSIFTGFFAALSIGWEIIKEGTKFIVGLAKSLLGLVSGPASNFAVKIAEGFTKLQEVLVKGGGIKDFFAGLTDIIQKPIRILEKFRDAISEVFGLFSSDVSDKVGEGFGRLGDRFANLKDLFSSVGDIWQPFENGLMRIVAVLDAIWTVIKDWFSKLGDKIAELMGEAKFNNVLDAINTGLLGGIALLLAKFIKSGFSFDIGSGFLEKAGKSFEQLTGVLKAMQLQIKAQALLKIAAAIAVLTASVVVLSMIDSVKLTAALTAMAVGFGQLVGTFALLNTLGPTSAAKLSVMAAGLILLAGAMLILSVAVKIFSTMNWDELLRGLAGVGGGLAAMAIGMHLMPSGGAMIFQGAGLMAVAVAMGILAVSMKIFATMDWGEMAKGFVGIGGGLLIIAGAMQLMPNPVSMALQSASLILIAVALSMIAGVMAIFGTMDWETIAKGLVGIGGGLLVIAGAMQLMPMNLPITAAGLILVGVALGEIGLAMKLFAKFSWDEIARGLTGMAGALLILAGSLYLMGQTGLGAASLVVAAVGLGLLFAVLKQFTNLKMDDLLNGLLNMGIALAALALASLALQPAVPLIAALGGALIVLGIGIALIGGGIFALAKGLETLGKLGSKAAENIKEMLKSVGEAMPAFLTGVAEGIVEMIKVFTDAAPQFAEAIVTLLGLILKKMEELIPQVGVIIRMLVVELFAIIRSYASEYIATGLFIITQLLNGIKNNIGQIVALAADIIVNFLTGIQQEAPRLADSIADTIVTAVTSAANALGQVAGSLLLGVGKAFIDGLIQGVDSQTGGLMSRIMAIPGEVLSAIGDTLGTLVSKGADIITGLLNGITSMIGSVLSFIGGIPGQISGAFTDVGVLLEKGIAIIQGLIDGIIQKGGEAIGAVTDIARNIMNDGIPNPFRMLWDAGMAIMQGLWDGLKKKWEAVKDWLSNLNPANWFNDINLKKGHAAKNLLPTGEAVMIGLHYGMQEKWKDTADWLQTLDPSEEMNKNIGANMTKVLAKVSDQMGSMENFNPTITPVLDLTRVQDDAKKIAGYIQAGQGLKLEISSNQARVIARSHNVRDDISTPQDVAPTEGFTFTQINNSPTQLSTSDIYKATRNQIRIAKEELRIP